MSSPALSVRGVIKRFGNHIAVDGISFEIPRGVIYGILGPNGAGKSTTLRMINDIIAPDAGEIRILDNLAPGSQAARQIGYLPEERGLYPKMKVCDMIIFMGELRGLRHRDAKQRAHKWLERLGLAQWAKNKVQDLSKGMAQKVQFATALIHEPQLVILDEPWSGLDPINAEVLREVVEEIRAAGRTVLFSTHGMEQAEKVCDAVCIIARGKKVLDGKLRDIKREAIAEGVVALGFSDEESRTKAEGPLDDKHLVIERKPPRPGEHADCEVVLAKGVKPQQLLATLLNHDVGVRLFEVVVPTLHDIFVQRVGNATVAERRPEEDTHA
ncbi:MAG TPA: ATP-binding cassette domain-containing protein [Kofleriaceae bacterium]|jgi:ABC-2 type transport system ATP-binding protein|nr:ATP-binding cassette domain-containing protein [Kofleriaceae bacterium]